MDTWFAVVKGLRNYLDLVWDTFFLLVTKGLSTERFLGHTAIFKAVSWPTISRRLLVVSWLGITVTGDCVP